MTLVNALVALVAASLTPAAADIPLVPIGNIQTFRRADATVPMPTNFVIEGQIVASAGRRAVLSDGTASIRIFPLPAPDDETSEDWRVDEAKDGNEAVTRAHELRPDIIVMDGHHDARQGRHRRREEILRERPETRIIFLTTSNTPDDLNRAVQLGARGVLVKCAANAELLKAVQAVSHGDTFISPEAQQIMKEEPALPKLTTRQAEILHSLTRGLSNKDIAEQFGISANCVKLHITVILSKLGAANRAEAVAIALQNHILRT